MYGGFDLHPALIVCRTPPKWRDDRDDRGERHPLAVRGSSHSNAGQCLVDDGIVIDLREMTGLEIDPFQTASAEQVSRRATQHGGGGPWLASVSATRPVGIGGMPSAAVSATWSGNTMTIDNLSPRTSSPPTDGPFGSATTNTRTSSGGSVAEAATSVS